MDSEYFWFEPADGVRPQDLAARFVKAGHVQVVINYPLVGLVPFGPEISEAYAPKWASSIEKHFGCRRVEAN